MPPKARATRQIVAISVKLEVNTTDQLRRVVFGLTKGTEGELATWTLNFEFFEREDKRDELVKIVDLEIEVKAKNNEAVEKAATEGFTKSQAEFASTTAAAAAKRLADGKITEAAAARTIERTFNQ
jgi:hypothetical protein